MSPRIFLSLRSPGEGGCGMRITDDVRMYTAEQGITDEEALNAGMEQKSRE